MITAKCFTKRLGGQTGDAPATGDSGRHLTRLFQLKEPWEHALSALLELTQTGPEPKPAQTRLVWWIHWHSSGSCAISPREQKRDARGQWTQGRPVALKRLYRPEKLEFLTPQDRDICAAVRADYSGYYGQTSYEIDPYKALPLVVDHPLVFWEDTPGVRVELVKGEPELLIAPQGSQWRLELVPQAGPDEPLMVVKETPTRLKVIVFNEAHKQVMAILGDGLLEPVRKIFAALWGILRPRLLGCAACPPRMWAT